MDEGKKSDVHKGFEDVKAIIEKRQFFTEIITLMTNIHLSTQTHTGHSQHIKKIDPKLFPSHLEVHYTLMDQPHPHVWTHLWRWEESSIRRCDR